MLNELPKSLDETYERILKEIPEPYVNLVQQILQCMVVATRPLQVAELEEVPTIKFESEGLLRLEPDQRWENLEQELLIACPNLITIVGTGHSRIVQFSHFSIQEFLTRPATTSDKVSNYHIHSESAHTILAQACLGILLKTQNDVEGHTPEDHPLVRYAARHWTTHVQIGEVSSRLHKAMEYLFDANKPHFKLWLTLYDMDIYPNEDATFWFFIPHDNPPAAPLYYAALCGFDDLVKHLITKHPQDVNADGGLYVRPLLAALAGEHFQTADLLHHNGADLDVRSQNGRKPLHGAAYSGNLEVVRRLIEYDPAAINARDEDGWTPLHMASSGHNFKDGSVVRLLLEHGADINAQKTNSSTPLHVASRNGALNAVRLLFEHGADVEVKNNDGETALQYAAWLGYDEVVKFLREHGVK
jgi:Ankyrin repeats (3 copies)/Ankyrin repeats (many copies)